MNAALKRMTADEFLVWCLDQDDRYELVGGYPIRMMTGATKAHDGLVVNVISALRYKLKAPCRVHTADIASRMQAGNLRRPDVTIDCGGGDRRSLESARPTVFFEVLSPSTRGFDMVRKPEEYRLVESLDHVVMLDADTPRAWVLSRATEGWNWVDVLGLQGVIDLPGVSVRLPMSEIYADMDVEQTF